MRDIRIGVWSSGLAAIQMSQLSPRQSHPDTPCMQVIDPLCRQACGTPSKGNGHSAATMACELLERWRALAWHCSAFQLGKLARAANVSAYRFAAVLRLFGAGLSRLSVFLRRPRLNSTCDAGLVSLHRGVICHHGKSRLFTAVALAPCFPYVMADHTPMQPRYCSGSVRL